MWATKNSGMNSLPFGRCPVLGILACPAHWCLQFSRSAWSQRSRESEEEEEESPFHKEIHDTSSPKRKKPFRIISASETKPSCHIQNLWVKLHSSSWTQRHTLCCSAFQRCWKDNEQKATSLSLLFIWLHVVTPQTVWMVKFPFVDSFNN